MLFLFPTGDVTGDMMRSGFHYSGMKDGFWKQEPIRKQAWGILLARAACCRAILLEQHH